MKPIIGITCNYDYRGTVGTVTHTGPDEQDWSFVAVDYARAVEAAGGIPVMIPQYDDPEKAFAVLERIDGLLISGGNDVAPSFYGEAIRDCSGNFFPMRDELEIGLAKEAVRLKKPLLGICRGLQVINAAFGGTMYQDLHENTAYGPHMVIGMPKHLPTHVIKLTGGSLLREIYGSDTVMVWTIVPLCAQEEKHVPTAVALFTLMSNIGMLLGPPVCGAVIENFHSWKAGAIPVAAAMTIGTMLLLPVKEKRTQDS